jgi:4-amino-4-deoxy-L-arabinose transferase-like glycosyltransferase
MARGVVLTPLATPEAASRVRAALADPHVVALLLFGGAAAVRLALAAQVVFPPLGDAAYYISIAQRLYAGRGLTAGIIWSYQPPPPTVVGPSNDYWGPLPSVVEWLSFRVFGNHLYAALLPGVLAGAAPVALTYLCGRRVLRAWLLAGGVETARAERHADWLALGASLLLAVNAELTYQSVMGDSSMLYGIVAFPAILLWQRALRPPGATDAPSPWDRAWGWHGGSAAAWAAGILLGAAYLTRGSIVFLALAFAGWWIWRFSRQPWASGASDRQRLVGAALALVAGAALVIAPWLVREQLTFGHLVSPAAGGNALAFSIEEFADYGTSPTWATLWQHGLAANLALRADALWDALHHVTDFLFYPTCVPALFGLWLLARRQATAAFGLLNLLVLILGFALLFPAVSLFGGYYHSVASVAPFLAWGYVSGVYVVARWLRQRLPLRASLAPALVAIPVLLQAIILALAAPAIGAGAQHDARVYAAISAWLHAHHARVVMTTESSSLNYASGIPAIELPAAQSPSVAYACARRYGAQYLVMIGPSGAYPQILRDRPDPHFVLIARTPDYEVYHIGP